MRWVLFSLCCLLAACTPGQWTHPVIEADRSYYDKAICHERVGHQLAEWEPGAAQRWQAFVDCMERQGWTLVQER